MSGPKVVNLEAVRRRRQRESLSRLRELRDTVGEWRTALEHAGLLTSDLANEAEGMLARLERLRQGEQWNPLLAELTAQREFFQNGITNARQTGIQRAASLGKRRQQLAAAAAMLQREWQAAGVPAPSELDEISHAGSGSDENELSRLETVLQAAFSQLPGRATSEETASAPQRELAEALRSETGSPRTLVQWLATHCEEDVAQQGRNDRLARALAELELHAPADLAAPLFDKARLIATEPAAERRVLLTDSLLLEADAICRLVREREEAVHQLREDIAAVEPFQSAEAEAWRQRLTAALDNPSVVAIRELTSAAQAWCTAEAAREEAILRREVILRALAELGYEVRKGMSTAWAENGRVVVRKPAEPNYGVELASPPSGAAVQVRVVAFDVPGRSALSVQRDREVEQSWCGEFQHMRELIEKDGFAPTLQHAMAAGEVPLKIVPQAEGERRDTRSRREPSIQTRRSSS